jgi:hypothetical protein
MMTAEVTLTLPDNLIEYAHRLASATQRDTGSVLADSLAMLWTTLGIKIRKPCLAKDLFQI